MSLAAILVFTGACALLGYRVISAVPPLLHTPLMSGMNALSGITLLAALALLGSETTPVAQAITAVAAVLAGVNVVGGFWVTERMLRMFKQKGKVVDGEENV